MSPLVLAKFRVKIKSLAVEARIIRAEEKRCKSDSDRGNLRHHRITAVRDEQRWTLLAYAYVRGIPYCSVEVNSKRPVKIRHVNRILKSLAGLVDRDVEGWIDGQ